MLAIGLALMSSVLWGFSDYLGGVKSRSFPVPVVLAGTYGASLAVMLIFIAARGSGPPPAEYVLAGLGAGLVGIIGLSAFYRGLAIGTMSIVAPIAATGVVGAGDRRPDPRRRARPGRLARARASRSSGSCSPRARTTSRRSARASSAEHRARDRRRPGLRHVLRARRDRLATADVAWTLLLSRVSGFPVVALIALLVAAPRRARLQPGRSALAAIAGIGLLDLGANALFNVASTMGELSSVAVASSLYPVVTVMLAALLLGERVQGVQRVGVFVALTGVVLIAAGA